ncbi:MAG: hypothetical protein GX080_01405 [Tissierellia bacterium]|nr:hypothetical protein [Tissierellia bacterium]
MKQALYRINIRVLTPFNIATGENIGDFVSKSTIKYKGKPYIPASTIKGKIRDNFFMINHLNHREEDCSCPMCKIFGSAGYSPSRIYVDDFVTEEDSLTLIRYGNAIDRYRKIAKDKALFNEEVSANRLFKGTIKIYFDEETINYKEKLEMAIRMIESIGNSSSRGQGHVEIDLQEVS